MNIRTMALISISVLLAACGGGSDSSDSSGSYASVSSEQEAISYAESSGTSIAYIGGLYYNDIDTIIADPDGSIINTALCDSGSSTETIGYSSGLYTYQLTSDCTTSNVTVVSNFSGSANITNTSAPYLFSNTQFSGGMAITFDNQTINFDINYLTVDDFSTNDTELVYDFSIEMASTQSSSLYVRLIATDLTISFTDNAYDTIGQITSGTIQILNGDNTTWTMTFVANGVDVTSPDGTVTFYSSGELDF